MKDSHDDTRMNPRACRCLMVLPRGYDAPLKLTDGLRRRKVQVHEVSDPPAAMAEALLARYAILLLVEPDHIRDAQPLAAAVRKYCKHTHIWQYHARTGPMLSPLPALPDTNPTSTPPAPAANPRPDNCQIVTNKTTLPPVTSEKSGKDGETGPNFKLDPLTPRILQRKPQTVAPPRPANLRLTESEADQAAGQTTEPLDPAPLLTEEELSMLLGEDDL